jgi:two-component system chemotaxis response regulator CheB
MSIAVPTPPAHPDMGHEPIRVMVVDDAVVVRGLLARWIETEQGLQMVASLRSGREAIEQLDRANPDVVVLDVDMPDTDGITALPRLLEKKRDLVVIMASTLTRRNAEISLRALALGAADYIPKPETTREITTSAAFRRELIDKIRALGQRRKRRAVEARAPVAAPVAPARRSPEHDGGFALRQVASPNLVPAPEHSGLKLRPFPPTPPRVLLVGSSTGGPQALNALLGQINGVIDQAPVLVVQHMPPTFTTILAEHVARASGRPAREAIDGEEIRAGQIYIAPGGRHMRVIRRDGGALIQIDDGPAVNFCKPAVDPLFSSAAAVWGPKNLGLVLTGMGSDGARGAAELVAAGGSVIAQDEETSVVWGMPGSVANAGLCSAVLPLQDIAPRIVRLFSGGRS